MRYLWIDSICICQGDYDDWERAVRCADRVLKLSPNNAEALRDRGLGYLRLGHTHGAQQDLTRYLQLHPDASDSTALREKLIGLGRQARPH